MDPLNNDLLKALLNLEDHLMIDNCYILSKYTGQVSIEKNFNSLKSINNITKINLIFCQKNVTKAIGKLVQNLGNMDENASINYIK